MLARWWEAGMILACLCPYDGHDLKKYSSLKTLKVSVAEAICCQPAGLGDQSLGFRFNKGFKV
jgi:hypothetical protein